MKLTEIKNGWSVTIEVIQGLTKLKINSKAVKYVPQGLLINCIRCNRKVVGFNAPKVIYNAYIQNPLNNQTHVWKDIKITQGVLDGTIYHILVIDKEKDSELVNRRKSYRVYVGIKGVAQLGSHRNAYDVKIRDISETGIAIISKDNIDIHKNAIGRVSFTDTSLNVRFDFQVSIVRKETKSDNEFLYGCVLKGLYPELHKYLAKKQLDKVRSTRSKNGIR